MSMIHLGEQQVVKYQLTLKKGSRQLPKGARAEFVSKLFDYET